MCEPRRTPLLDDTLMAFLLEGARVADEVAQLVSMALFDCA